MKIKDPHDFRGGLNTDDSPSNLPPGDYVGSLNARTLSSDEQHGAGIWETLQGEIEILLGVAAPSYYGGAIGGEFIYYGFDEITIGDQTWMKKNYDVDYPGSKVYNDNEVNASIYGRLYTHNQAMSADFCPPGWRVPTEADIDELLTFLGGEMLAGGKMKEVGDSHWTDPNTGADDSSAFRAVPGGKFDLLFELLGGNCILWLQDDGEPSAPLALNGSEITGVTFMANWSAVAGASGYYLDVATDALFTAMVAGFDNLDVGNVLSYEVTGLSGSTDYYFRVRAYNEVGTSDNSNIMSLTTLLVSNDWFLPSKDELNAMYVNLYLEGVGDFSVNPFDYWWSSSELNATDSWIHWFHNGGLQTTVNKTTTYAKVRACRSFVAGIGDYSLRDTGPSGGLIFYIDGVGTTYYEAAPSDLSGHSIWSNITLALGTTGTAIGTGQTNTNAIIAQIGHTDSAAKLCNDLVI